MRQMEALDDEYGAPDVVAALEWPLSPVAEESPELATRLADDFAARCLPPGAFYTIRCDEYPCVLGYDMTDLIDERCGDEQWSEADFRYTMSATSRLRGMFLAPPGADATWIEEVRATRRRRLSAILDDRVHHFNARVWPTLEARSD